MTLFCQLYYDPVYSYCVVGSEDIELIWVNQADVNLQTDSSVEKCDGKTAHRWGIWLLSERERSSDPHH